MKSFEKKNFNTYLNSKIFKQCIKLENGHGANYAQILIISIHLTGHENK